MAGYRTRRHLSLGENTYIPGDQVDVGPIPSGRLASMLRLGMIYLDPALSDTVPPKAKPKASKKKVTAPAAAPPEEDLPVEVVVTGDDVAPVASSEET